MNTPVSFFIFNRPGTTRKVFEAIRNARPKRLFVVADGPRAHRSGEKDLCEEARAIIKEVDWDCDVRKNYSEENLGCKHRVSSGLDWIFASVEEAIILEDDCLPHPCFFGFCETLLDTYRDDPRVMMIAGTNYLLDRMEVKESYFFSRYFAIWGWATWSRAWKKYDLAMSEWENLRDKNPLEVFYRKKDMHKYFSKMFDEAYRNTIDTWDIQWFYSCLFNNGLSIVPKVNLVSNIGLTGTHTTSDSSNNNLPVFALNVSDMVHPTLMFPRTDYVESLFETRIRKGSVERILRKIRR